MQGITIHRGAGPTFNLTVSSKIYLGWYSITVSTSNYCSITEYTYSIIAVDMDYFASRVNFGELTATTNNRSSLTLVLQLSTPSSFFIAMSSFVIGANTLSYSYDLTSLTCTGSSNFTVLEFSYFNYRQRNCPAAFPYFLSADSLCYDICPSGYMPSNTYNTCIACDYKCQTCSASSTSTCLTCNSSQFRLLSGTTCICQSGYYNFGVAMCSMCDYTCLTCNSSTNCTSCSATNFRALTTGKCPCKSGYADIGVPLCSMCSTLITGCVNCTSSTVCTACSGGYILTAGSCICSSGTYPSGGGCALCSSAMVGCTGCTSSTACTVCNSTAYYQLIGSNCNCLFGYYSSATSCLSCSTAMLGCVSCTNSANCLVCDATNNFIVDPVFHNCICATGYYLSGSVCISCSINIPMCSQCTSSTVCVLCTAPTVIVGTVCGCAPDTYTDGLGNCIGCSTILQGCNACTSSTICTGCDSTANYVLAGGNCQCASGYFLNGGICVVSCPLTSQFFNGTVCVACHVSCAICLGPNLNNCTQCISPNTLQNGQCLCPTGQYMDATFTCQSCDSLCLTCTDSSTNCTSCLAPMIPSGITCICSDGLYLPTNGDICQPCDPSCIKCTGSNNFQCITCATSFVLTGTTCGCAALQYIDPRTGNCTACHYSCLTCNGTSSTDCLSCDSANSRSLSGNNCPCISGKFEIGNAACYSSNCQVGYGPDVNGVCVQICGDGVLYVLPCDDGNTVSGDGCSSTCNIEPYYTCQGGNSTSPTICSYNQPVSLTLMSTTKNLTDNIVYFDIQISPALSSLNGLNFSSVFTTNFTGANLTFNYNSLTGRLMVIAQYTSPIQSQNITVLFNPTSSSSHYFFATPPTSFSFVVNPDNNLAAELLSIDTYSQVKAFEILWQVLMYLSLAGLSLSLFTARFIGVEMVGVIQVAFIGLMIIDYLQPLMSPITKMFPINGLNNAFSNVSATKTLPNRISALQYGTLMVQNFNFSIIVLLLPPLVSLIVYITSKIRRDIEDKLKKISLNILCDFGLTASVFFTYQVVTSLAIFMVFASPEMSSLYGGSVAESIVVLFVMATILVLFRYFPQNFGDYRKAFQEDTFSQYHYYFLIAFRVLLPILLSIANDSSRVGYVCLIPSFLSLVYISKKRPYCHLYNNIRAIANEAIVFTTLLIYAYYRSAVTFQSHMTATNNALPYVLAVLLFGCVIVNIVFMVKWKCNDIRENTINNRTDTEVDLPAAREQDVAEITEMKNIQDQQPKRKRRRFTRRNAIEHEVTIDTSSQANLNSGVIAIDC